MALVLIGVAGYLTVGRYLLARGTSTPVPLEEIEERYHSSTTSTAVALPTRPPSSGTAAANPVLPVPGVYLYTTQGEDKIDALAGDQHGYPATTTITITASGCGVLQRWDVLRERWESWQRCVAGDGVAEPARTNYDEFFSNGVLEEFTCTGDARPVDAPAGSTWSAACTNGDESQTMAGMVIGREPRTVGGAEVDTLHVTVTVTDADPRNQQVIDTWYLLGSDLVVAQMSTDHAVNPSPIGDVNYDESYQIQLTSLEPVT